MKAFEEHEKKLVESNDFFKKNFNSNIDSIHLMNKNII